MVWSKARRVRVVGVVAGLCSLAMVGAGCGSSSSSAGGSGQLKIITWINPPSVKALKVIDAEFHKKYPNISVKLGTAADVSGPYATLLQTTVDSHSADIVSSAGVFNPLPPKPTRNNESNWQFWSTHGVFLPLNGQSWLKDYQPGVLQDETYKGKTYGVATNSYEEGVFYNKADFAKYGLKVPTTYDQFVAVCKALKSHGVTPLFDGLGQVGAGYLQFIYEPLMNELWRPKTPGGDLAKALTEGKAKWTDPAFATVMNEEKTIGSYLEPGYTGVAWESMPGAFANGKAAMLLDGSWDMPTVHSANAKMKVGFFPLPGSNEASANQPITSPNLTFSILKNAPDSANAQKWMAFFSSPRIYAQWIKITGGSATKKSGSYGGFTAGVLGKWFGKGDQASAIMPTLPTTGAYWDETTNWPKLQLDVIQGSKTPAQVQKLYQTGWNG